MGEVKAANKEGDPSSMHFSSKERVSLACALDWAGQNKCPLFDHAKGPFTTKENENHIL